MTKEGAVPQREFDRLGDAALIASANNSELGLARGFAIEELARRALKKSELLHAACSAISSDRRIGFHTGVPLGWLGADAIYLSKMHSAVEALLREMDSWEASEQEDLVRHWAGKGRLAEVTQELESSYNWHPRYNV